MSEHAQVIYDAGEIKAIYQPAESDYVVFSFNGMGFSETGKRFFGDLFFAKRGIAAVGLVDTKSTWFRDPRFTRAIDAIAAYMPLRNGQRRLTYGASMGGYGALKYGGALNAHAALAVGAQTSIDPAQVGSFDRRYRRFFDAALHDGMELAGGDLCSHNFFFYDPVVAQDRQHATLLADVPRMHPIVSPFIGHPGIVFFTQLRLIQEMFPLAAMDAPHPGDFRRLVRAHRRHSAEYWFNRAEYLRRHQPSFPAERVLQAYREAVRLNYAPADHADTVKLTSGCAEALLDSGHAAEATTLIDRLWASRERGFSIPGLQALLNKAGDEGRLRAIADSAAARQGDALEPLLDRARILFMSGDTDGANAAADAARALAGRSIMAWRRLRWLYQRLGREADVAAAQAMIILLDPPRSHRQAPPGMRPRTQRV